MKKYRTKVITDESQVPAGYKRISALADSITDQKKLSDAHTVGLIEAVKLMRSTDDRTGPVWVDAEAAKRVLATDKPAASKKGTGDPAWANARFEAAVIALCEINNGITLMLPVLERIATAVESIATQPKTPHQELMAAIGTNGNGFHQ